MPLFVSRIPWRLKSVAFRVLSVLPPFVYRWISKHVTGRSIRDLSNQGYFRALEAHLTALNDATSTNDSILFEFGAGADLFSSLFFSSRGIRRQIVVDLQRTVTPEALNALIAHAEFIDDKKAFTADFVSELQHSGITYLAPYDVRECQLADRSVSFICSTNTLEHIPEPDLSKILSQCNRIIRQDGVVSMWIDYSDHYSHTDSAISAYSFLQFSEKQWAPHNSRLQFQNRLRHCHYRSFFIQAGFEVVKESRFHGDGWERDLDSMHIDKDFIDCSREDLGATCGHFVLRPLHRAR